LTCPKKEKAVDVQRADRVAQAWFNAAFVELRSQEIKRKKQPGILLLLIEGC
jgi:hypothetical protein